MKYGDGSAALQCQGLTEAPFYLHKGAESVMHY